MATNWSSKLARQFSLRLPDDVSAWLDGGLWQRDWPTSFGWPVEPEGLLDPRSAAVWGGGMLPDTLPILGNGCGDVLCLRFAANGTVYEVVRWQHEGTWWAPYGSSLAEALLLDAAMARMEDPSPHAAPHADLLQLVDWALQWIPGEASELSSLRLSFVNGQPPPMDSLLQANLAQTAVRRERCRQYLTSGLSVCGGQRLADRLRVKWPEFSTWLFDSALIPARYEKKLARATRIPIQQLRRQDWEAAAQEAQKVNLLRTDLAWPFAVLGWTAERQGDLRLAIHHYRSGLRALGTTADFTEGWAATTERVQTKFVADRLKQLRKSLPPDALEDGYLQAVLNAQHAQDALKKTRDYWHDSATSAQKEGRYEQTYHCYYAAGWDIHCLDDMDSILDSLAGIARAADWPSLASIAEHHLSSLVG